VLLHPTLLKSHELHNESSQTDATSGNDELETTHNLDLLV